MYVCVYLCQQATKCRWTIADIKRLLADWAVNEHAFQDGQEEGHTARLGASRRDIRRTCVKSSPSFFLPCPYLGLLLFLAVSLPQWEGSRRQIHILQQGKQGLHTTNRCKHILIT